MTSWQIALVSFCGAWFLGTLVFAIVIVRAGIRIKRTAKPRYEKPVAMDFSGEDLPGGDDRKLDIQDKETK
jgi:hypothetical protein